MCSSIFNPHCLLKLWRPNTVILRVCKQFFFRLPLNCLKSTKIYKLDQVFTWKKIVKRKFLLSIVFFLSSAIRLYITRFVRYSLKFIQNWSGLGLGKAIGNSCGPVETPFILSFKAQLDPRDPYDPRPLRRVFINRLCSSSNFSRQPHGRKCSLGSAHRVIIFILITREHHSRMSKTRKCPP